MDSKTLHFSFFKLLDFNSFILFFLFQINSKYSEELAAECLEWVKEITGEPINTNGDMDNFFEVLKDGVILCKLVNAIKPGSVKKINESKMAFKCMENLTAFVDVSIKVFNVPNQETFQSVDLWERQNLNAVVICLQSLGRKVGQYGKPTIGPKEADKNVRQFSDDQMRAGKNSRFLFLIIFFLIKLFNFFFFGKKI